MKLIFIFAIITKFVNLNASANTKMREALLKQTQLLPPITLEEMSGIKLMNRTDTKFVATLEQLNKFLLAVQGQYYIQQINDKRVASYHTTYFDTADFAMYVMHHNGKARREKIRMRTYLDSNDTFLEVKNKNNHGRTKKKRIEVAEPHTLEKEAEQAVPFLAKCAWYTIDELTPVIENFFSRITLVNFGKTERLTIDFDLRFHNLVTDERDKFNNVVIIELKRDGNVPSPALDIIRALRIRRSGFSKYCIGSALTNKSLRRNNFKERLRFIEKLENK